MHQNVKLNISVVALKTVSPDNKRTTCKASKVKLKTNGMSRINSNIQLCCDTASSTSLLMSMFVTGLTSSNTIVMTSLIVTLSKIMRFYKDVFLILLYSKLYTLLSFSRQMHQLESCIYCVLCP